MSAPLALVTGATGFIAKHVVLELLARGYRVRGSVRSVDRGEQLRGIVRAAGYDDARLELALSDLEAETGWSEAVAGAEVVHHVASPFPMRMPADRNDVIRPARDGAMRVLAAALEASVPRIVMTSSIVAVVYPTPDVEGRLYDERDWTDPARSDLSAYVASKTIAERAAWSLMEARGASSRLAVINPGFVQGPALDTVIGTSHGILRRMARGEFPAAPRAGYAMADVRDVAVAHVRAGELVEAGGGRILIANGFMRLVEIGAVLAATLPDLARKVPRLEVPDVAVRAMALLDSSVRAVLPDLGRERRASNDRARRLLGMAFRSPREAVAAAARSLRELGLL